MAETTGIAWTDATFNPWIGCQKVSPGCDHCYAETFATRRLGAVWGPGAERRRTSPDNWRMPVRLNARAYREHRRTRVFCASLADVFDKAVPAEWRRDLWDLIWRTPRLDWQLLTKRPQNVAKMLPPEWGHGWPNVWLGTTVENQAEADRRIPVLRRLPAARRFLSCEPLLEPVDLRLGAGGIHWVIAGGESGAGCRLMPREAVDSVRDQCAAAGVAFFMKQTGAAARKGWPLPVTGPGADPAEWPEDLRVREFPPPVVMEAV